QNDLNDIFKERLITSRSNDIKNMETQMNNYLSKQYIENNIIRKMQCKLKQDEINPTNIIITYYDDKNEPILINDLDEYLFSAVLNNNVNDSINTKINTNSANIRYKYDGDGNYRKSIIDYCKEIGLTNEQSEYVKNKICNSVRNDCKYNLHPYDLKIWIKGDHRIYGLEGIEIKLNNGMVICYNYCVRD
ncbi:hypothetical protein AB2T90_10975, partial [Clostridium butyricum]|uniref:hypothetical protein n=1 Tax=Clostridium butyricum TaxID=1492 RepID=UPI00346578B9